MGKYSKALEGIPAEPVDPDTLQRYDEVKQREQLLELTPVQLAARYVRYRAEHEAAKAAASEVWEKVQTAEYLLRLSQESGEPGWGEYGVEKNAMRLPSGETVRFDDEPDPCVIDREAFHRWCLANGYVRDMHVHPSKMASIACERLVAGEAQPDGIEVKSYKKIVLTKAKKAKKDPVDISSFMEVE